MGAKRKSKAGETPDLWERRLEASWRLFQIDEAQRERYRRGLAMDWFGLTSAAAGMAFYDLSMMDTVPVNVSHLYHQALLSKSYDEDPDLKLSRETMPDAKFGSRAEVLLKRLHREAKAADAHRRGVTSFCTVGSYVTWYGLPTVMQRETVESSKSAPQQVEEALVGVHEPVAGQDHDAFGEAADAVLNDPNLTGLALPEPAAESLIQASGEHVTLEAEEAKRRDDWNHRKGLPWSEHSPVGTWTRWDGSVYDFDSASWLARKFCWDEERATTYDGFRPSARALLRVTPLDREDYEQIARTEGVSQAEIDKENGRVVLWQIWDRKNRAVHWISPGVDEFLEVDESNPYVHPETGEDLLPGFFPAVYCAPFLDASEKPVRTFGIAGFKPGWPQQIELIKIESFTLAAVKRSGRTLVVHNQMGDEEREALEDGSDGTVVTAPEGVEPTNAAAPINWGVVPPAVFEAALRILSRYAMAQGISLADLTGEPVADTLGQEEMAASGAAARTTYVVRQFENAYGQGAAIIRALIPLIPDERLGAMLEDPAEVAAIKEWAHSSAVGDLIEARFASRARMETEKRVGMLLQAIQLASTQTITVGGVTVPKYDTDHLIREAFELMGAGAPVPYKPSPFEIKAMAAGAAAGMPSGQGPAATQSGAGSGGPPQPGPGGPPRQPRPGQNERARGGPKPPQRPAPAPSA